jgi:hypothetical protein
MNWLKGLKVKRLRDWFRGDTLGVLKFDPLTGQYSHEDPRWRLEPIFAWYDFWVGVYVDRKNRKIYCFPIPCVGFVFYWG